MGKSTLKLTGTEEMEKKLMLLDGKVRQKVWNSAFRAAAKPIISSAKARIKRNDTGMLRESLGVKVKVSTKKRVAYAVIGPRLKFGKAEEKIRASGGKRAKKATPAWYAHLVEFGTKAHPIRAGKQGFLGFLGVVTKVVNHPGSRSKPFLKPAFDATILRSQKVWGEKLWAGIRKYSK